jgi:hypothetical protein
LVQRQSDIAGRATAEVRQLALGRKRDSRLNRNVAYA